MELEGYGVSIRTDDTTDFLFDPKPSNVRVGIPMSTFRADPNILYVWYKSLSGINLPGGIKDEPATERLSHISALVAPLHTVYHICKFTHSYGKILYILCINNVSSCVFAPFRELVNRARSVDAHIYNNKDGI